MLYRHYLNTNIQYVETQRDIKMLSLEDFAFKRLIQILGSHFLKIFLEASRNGSERYGEATRANPKREKISARK